MVIDPKEYGLSSRIRLEQLNENHIAIVKIIKSRIIQKDALKIINIAASIKSYKSEVKISLICNPNICSKSTKLFIDNGIEIIHNQ